jgi:hypothetical protein
MRNAVFRAVGCMLIRSPRRDDNNCVQRVVGNLSLYVRNQRYDTVAALARRISQ